MTFSKFFKISFFSLCVIFLMFAAVQCGGDDDTKIPCTEDKDCPENFSCIVALNVCGVDNSDYFCYKDSDCLEGYKCQKEKPEDEGGQCVLESVDGDSESEEEAE